MHDVTIAVVTYNSERFVRDCIGSLLAHSPKDFSTQIVVVDNASQDRTVAILKEEFPSITLIESSENLGFGRGNNLAMENAPARYYYLHNADAYLQGDSLNAALHILEHEQEIGIAGLPLVFPDQSPQTGAYGFTTPAKWLLQGLGVRHFAKWVATSDQAKWLRAPLSRISMAQTYIRTHSSAAAPLEHSVDVDWVCGASLILREQVRQDLNGGFDPDIFLYGEDEDMCIRAQQSGWRVAQVPATPVIHEFGWGSSGKSSPVVSRLKADSLKVFINKHFKNGSPKWLAMRAMLWVQKKRWGV
ncbi:glycosyltransferase family 2 protein [Celeribacter baekdonensis]|uniref:glycosyltransferase family 2 protein n=1 Tax=Pseudomonadota TaxID=1224 RepID=UPI003A90B891|tara:strand:- start:8891 stop:9796 length:906 start_codon:yes stop_codon:yes gene_type:complete